MQLFLTESQGKRGFRRINYYNRSEYFLKTQETVCFKSGFNRQAVRAFFLCTGNIEIRFQQGQGVFLRKGSFVRAFTGNVVFSVLGRGFPEPGAKTFIKVIRR